MEDQGIMALPMGGMQAPTTAPSEYPMGDAAVAAFDQARTQINPKEFGDDLLGAAEEADPAAVQEFRLALQRMQLPEEIIDALGDMVDILLSEPENYAENRAAFISEGVPEEFLPAQFDAAYFGAMNLALDQISAQMGPAQPQGFAKGGIAMLPIPAGLASMGRGQDSMLAHVSPSEARLLRRRGGAGTINPFTGRPEYIKKVFKAVAGGVGAAFKGATKLVKGAVKGIVGAAKKFASSTVGRIVTTIALGFFLGPAAAGMLGVSSAAGVAAVSGFIGSAGSTLLSGGSVKDAFKAGAIGGLTAGAGAAATGGMSAFQAGSYTGPTTIAGQVDKFTEGLKSLGGAPTSAAGSSTISADQLGTGVDSIDAMAGTSLGSTPQPDLTLGRSAIDIPPSALGQPGTNVAAVQGPIADAQGSLILPSTAAPPPPLNAIDQLDLATGQESTIMGPVATPQSFTDMAKGAYQDYVRPYTPAGIREAGAIEASTASNAASNQYINNALQTTGYNSVREMPVALQSEVLKGSQLAGQAAAKAATPGLFSQYAPVVAAGTGAAYLAGAFDPVQPERPNIIPSETGFDLFQKDPNKYGATPGGANVTYTGSGASPGYGTQPGYTELGGLFSPPQYQVNRPQDYMQRPFGVASLQPRGYFKGGLLQAVRSMKSKQALPPEPAPAPAPVTITVPASSLSREETLKQMSAPFQTTIGSIRGGFGGLRSIGTATTPVQAPVQAPVGPRMGYSGQNLSRLAPRFVVNRPVNYSPGLAALASRKFAMRGFAEGGGISSLKDYPRRTGQISGPGTETSDSIPAMLSDGEFVMTAQAVRGAGKGSRREGAKRMYQLMRKFERKA